MNGVVVAQEPASSPSNEEPATVTTAHKVPEAQPTPAEPPSTAVIITSTTAPQPEFGPIVTTYLAYLEAEQGVVDDSRSRHEVSPLYFRYNANRVKALRVMALRLARASNNDYLPELVAVGRRELRSLLVEPPKPQDLRVEEVYQNTFRYLGSVGVGADVFYIFARLDPYEQEELLRYNNN